MCGWSRCDHVYNFVHSEDDEKRIQNTVEKYQYVISIVHVPVIQSFYWHRIGLYESNIFSLLISITDIDCGLSTNNFRCNSRKFADILYVLINWQRIRKVLSKENHTNVQIVQTLVKLEKNPSKSLHYWTQYNDSIVKGSNQRHSIN